MLWLVRVKINVKQFAHKLVYHYTLSQHGLTTIENRPANRYAAVVNNNPI